MKKAGKHCLIQISEDHFCYAESFRSLILVASKMSDTIDINSYGLANKETQYKLSFGEVEVAFPGRTYSYYTDIFAKNGGELGIVGTI
jgi:hypothetical protein